jgi:hypothetical protein
MANPYLFNLTDDEALDVIYKIEELVKGDEYFYQIWATLLAQYNALPTYISTQNNIRLRTEDGNNLITENSN